MRDYFRVLHLIFALVGHKYLVYLVLCLFEIVRNIAFLLSAYFGVVLINSPDAKANKSLMVSLVLAVLCELLVLLINVTMNKIEEKLELTIYEDVLRKSAHVPYSTLYSNHFQSLLQNVLENSTSAIAMLAVNMSDYVSVLAHFCIFIYLAWQGGLVFIFTTIIFIGIAQYFNTRLDDKQEEARAMALREHSRKRYYTDLLDLEKNHAEIVMNNAVDYFKDKTHATYTSFYQTNNMIKKRVEQFEVRTWWLMGLGVFTSGAMLLYSVQSHNLSTEKIIVILMSLILFYTELSRALTTLAWDKEALYNARNYFELQAFAIDKFVADNQPISSLILKNVSLLYGDVLAVDNCSLNLKRGEVMLIIGSNGAGKTSLLNMIAGLYQPLQGGIYYIGEDHTCHPSPTTHPSSQSVKLADCQVLRQKTSYVSQSYPMLSLTIRESFFCTECSDEDIIGVLKKVKLWDLVKACPLGLEGKVGHDIFFSKGQWQRFTIARLLLHQESDIWILDEPTSAMDALNEQEILDLVCQEAQDKILIIVTHRLGIATYADKILHLQEGKVVFAGTHEEMLATDTQYRRAYEEQRSMYR